MKSDKDKRTQHIQYTKGTTFKDIKEVSHLIENSESIEALAQSIYESGKQSVTIKIYFTPKQ